MEWQKGKIFIVIAQLDLPYKDSPDLLIIRMHDKPPRGDMKAFQEGYGSRYPQSMGRKGIKEKNMALAASMRDTRKDGTRSGGTMSGEVR